jgi:ribosomal protein S27E
VDGNAAAGALTDVFATDVTTANGRCDSCGRISALAQAKVFNRAPGLVLRCAGCGAVLLRLVRVPGHVVLDMRGLAHLELVGSTYPGL